ncbi:MAG: HAMP domain-containing sensor histidine kinase [Pseudomonadota bacterium]
MRPRASIITRLVIGFAFLVLVLAAAAVLAVWGLQRSRDDLRRSEQSFVQLETVRTIEAAFDRYLLGEIARRLGGGGDPAESVAAAELRGTLLIYRRQIGAEIATATSDAERDAERSEMIRAAALSDLFETIEAQAMLDRTRGPVFDATEAARIFLDEIVALRDDAFRAVIFEVLADERSEAEAAFAGLAETRVVLIWAGFGLAMLLLVSVAVFALLLHRGLMRPIRALASSVQSFGAGDKSARAPAGMPGEFSLLADGFNQMATRLAGEQSRLQDQVSARTAELETANAELTRIDRSRREFFANISHELRTPVTVLLGEAQIARAAKGEAPLREALERVAASGGFLRRRLDDLMRLARSEDGQLSLTLAAADLTEIAASAVTMATSYAEANEITLDADLPSPPLWANCDAEALRQALLALIDNAIKFTPPGGVVSVSLAKAPDAAVLSVADTGTGIEGDPSQLFDRYAQDSTGRQAGGTGLGLAIAKWIAEQHGGRISGSNRASGGAEFQVEVPL